MTDCWLYAGPITMYGYGVINSQFNKYFAHRVMYENDIGAIPEGLDIDHLCRERSCINPSHLEAVTRRVNVLRGEGLSAQHARKTHCRAGHKLTPTNVVTITSRPNTRRCRTCDNAARKARHLRFKQGILTNGKDKP